MVVGRGNLCETLLQRRFPGNFFLDNCLTFHKVKKSSDPGLNTDQRFQYLLVVLRCWSGPSGSTPKDDSNKAYFSCAASSRREGGE